MTDYSDIFSEVSSIPYAVELQVKAYIGQQETSQNCCVGHKYHRHAFYEIAWVSEGPYSYSADFQSCEVPTGSLVFISPGQVHQWYKIHEQSNVIVVGFLPDPPAKNLTDVQKNLIDLPFFVEDAPPVYTVPDHLKAVFDQHFKTALDRAYVDPARSEAMIRAYLNLVLIEVQNTLASHPAPKIANQPAPIRLTRRFRLSVEKHFLQRIQVQDYADQLGVTPNHLVEMVRQTSGRTPKRIIQDRLLLEAKRLLAYSTLSTAEIGDELSFHNSTQFGRWFRTNEGVAPGQFRRHVLQ
ncbi:MAG: AraC family transcriptional regulator [Chloroflexota bacterium]